MTRRFLLVGLYTIRPFPQGTIMQVAFAGVTAIVYMMIQLLAFPYKGKFDNYIASASSMALCVMLLCVVLYKYSSLTELPGIESRMSQELRTDYTIDSVLLSILFVACIFVGLLFALVLFVVQIGAERRKKLLERAHCLRSKATSQEASLPQLPDRHFHIFLSHCWAHSGQDAMRTIKERLHDMLPEPEAQIFLDVTEADLEIGDLEGYIERSSTVLAYCTELYFRSKNCMRELVASVRQRKPVIALLEPDAKRGGLSQSKVRSALVRAEDSYPNWEFGVETPSSHELYGHLFADEPVEWNRIAPFQDATIRIIAERLLAVQLHGCTSQLRGSTYVLTELISKRFEPLPPPAGQATYHVYCSQFNPGAKQLLHEMANVVSQLEPDQHRRLQVKSVPQKHDVNARARIAKELREWRGKLTKSANTKAPLIMTQAVSVLAECQCMLVYLNSQTWTRDEESERFANEVREAMQLDVPLLLAHEMPGIGQDGNHACPFEAMFSCADGETPQDLLSRGIYKTTAVALKGGELRKTSMVLLARQFGRQESEVLRTDSALGLCCSCLGLMMPKAIEASLKRRFLTSKRHVLPAPELPDFGPDRHYVDFDAESSWSARSSSPMREEAEKKAVLKRAAKAKEKAIEAEHAAEEARKESQKAKVEAGAAAAKARALTPTRPAPACRPKSAGPRRSGAAMPPALRLQSSAEMPTASHCLRSSGASLPTVRRFQSSDARVSGGGYTSVAPSPSPLAAEASPATAAALAPPVGAHALAATQSMSSLRITGTAPRSICRQRSMQAEPTARRCVSWHDRTEASGRAAALEPTECASASEPTLSRSASASSESGKWAYEAGTSGEGSASGGAATARDPSFLKAQAELLTAHSEVAALRSQLSRAHSELAALRARGQEAALLDRAADRDGRPKPPAAPLPGPANAGSAFTSSEAAAWGPPPIFATTGVAASDADAPSNPLLPSAAPYLRGHDVVGVEAEANDLTESEAKLRDVREKATEAADTAMAAQAATDDVASHANTETSPPSVQRIPSRSQWGRGAGEIRREPPPLVTLPSLTAPAPATTEAILEAFDPSAPLPELPVVHLFPAAAAARDASAPSDDDQEDREAEVLEEIDQQIMAGEKLELPPSVQNSIHQVVKAFQHHADKSRTVTALRDLAHRAKAILEAIKRDRRPWIEREHELDPELRGSLSQLENAHAERKRLQDTHRMKQAEEAADVAANAVRDLERRERELVSRVEELEGLTGARPSNEAIMVVGKLKPLPAGIKSVARVEDVAGVPRRILLEPRLGSSRDLGLKSFTLDFALEGLASQEELYNTVGRSRVAHVVRGTNACIIAYGQTVDLACGQSNADQHARPSPSAHCDCL